jgi:hypothetical protein
MMCAVEMSLGGTIYIPIFMTTNLGIQVIFRFLSQQYERLQCWDCFIKYAVKMASA